MVIILPDGVRNYMSKPWFLDVAQDEAGERLRRNIRSIIGRDLGDVGTVLRKAEEAGAVLQKGDGVDMAGGKAEMGLAAQIGQMGLPATLYNPAALAA